MQDYSSRSKYTGDYLSNAVAKHLTKVKKEQSEKIFAERAQLAIGGSNFESDMNTTLKTAISLCIIFVFSVSIVRICFNFVRDWETLRSKVAIKVQR